jgi:hypothetical protein
MAAEDALHLKRKREAQAIQGIEIEPYNRIAAGSPVDADARGQATECPGQRQPAPHIVLARFHCLRVGQGGTGDGLAEVSWLE